jgi:hypothetical protein
MNNNQTLEKMHQMRLPGMHDAFRTSLETSLKETLWQDPFVAMPVASEWDDRRNRAVERAVKQADFRYKASLEQLDYSLERGLDMNLVHPLSSLDFVKERELDLSPNHNFI